MPNNDYSIEVQELNFYYGSFQALIDINIKIKPSSVTALIGPSGCGKSTFLRCLNRMNDTIAGVKVEGKILLDGEDIYAPDVDLTDLRKRVGMVFQKPNPFSKSIFDNVAFGPRVQGLVSDKDQLKDLVETSLKNAALWEDVKDNLDDDALGLSLGQQQRLCIARVLAVEPEVILMDEPASALDPIATGKIEELIAVLKENYTIVIVTHNMQQAARASDFTAFFNMDDDRAGYLVEYNDTQTIFTSPAMEITEQYITGRFG